MIGLDTNVLARYYVEDDADAPSTKQRHAAKRLIDSGQPLKVAKTVILELEWVLRGYYEFSQAQILLVLNHLVALPNVTIEDAEAVRSALTQFAAGLDLADALHHASYSDCTRMASFDDRRFARRAKRLGLAPGIIIPT